MFSTTGSRLAARSGWTEPAILGFVGAANTGEIELGQLGAKKATNAKVKTRASVFMNGL